jgi:threonine dehydrogenase-like Zn-dependent dehydrogenase
MKAVVFHGIGDIRLDNVAEPKLKEETDAIVRLTASAICGTDLHFVRGTLPNMQPGTVLGHEGVGIVEEIGKGVRNLQVGDRVVIPSTIGCGNCSYCREGYYAQCDEANPQGKDSGTAFYGGPKSSGPFAGLQAEYARIPFANIGLVKLPADISDDQAIMLSDIFPTGYFAARLAEIRPGDSVAVFGCGPVGLFSIVSAFLHNAGRVFAIDGEPSRLEMAKQHGAEAINFNEEDPIEIIRACTNGIGTDRVIDAVGVDAESPKGGPGYKKAKKLAKEFAQEVNEIAPETNPDGDLWVPGNAPSQVLRWGVEAVAKAGTLAIVGVYPFTAYCFPIGTAMNKNLTVNMGNCNHRRYLPELIRIVRSGIIDPTTVLTQQESILSAIEAYETFDRRQPGWLKVELRPAA